jgi:phasin family protein
MAAPRKSPARAGAPALKSRPASKSAATSHEDLVVAPVDAPAGAPEASPVVVVEAVLEQVGDFNEVVRQASASSFDQSKAAYSRLMEAAGEASASLEAAFKVSDQGVETLRLKALETFKTTSDASFDFVRSLADCKTLADVLTLQTEHARRQTETLNAQAKEYAILVQKVANDAMAPLTVTFGKGFGLTA